MLRGERRVALAFEIQDANEAVLQEKWNHKLRADHFAGVARDVARVQANVIETNRFARSSGVPGDSLIQLNAES